MRDTVRKQIDEPQQAANRPRTTAPALLRDLAASLLQLQRAHGNRFVQRMLLQAQRADGETEVVSEVENAIHRAYGRGQMLNEAIRVKMETAFGTDFSNVRVHTDAEADQLNQTLSARAFTVGQDIFFRAGEYAPSSANGRELLAHEIAHVVQQRGSQIRGKFTLSQPGDEVEWEADRAAQAFTQLDQHMASAKVGEVGAYHNQRLGYRLRSKSMLARNEGRPGIPVHDLAHVVQQPNVTDVGKGSSHPVGGSPITISQSVASGSVIHRRPAELLDNATFLSLTIGGGINTTMRDRLVQVQDHLQQVYDALGPNHPDRVHFGGAQKTLREWAGVNSIRGWRPGRSTSLHASGSAVDINYDLQPYIVTRTQVGDQTVYGGEAAGVHLQAERRAAGEVYDRAVQFIFNAPAADVSARRPGETTRAVYQRFSQTSIALSTYFRYALLEEPTAVTRQPIQNIESASEADLLAGIPTTERRSEANAVASLEFYMDENFRRTHPSWTRSPRETYFRMLRDYEHVRIPMQRGDPSARLSNTRNPTRGFLDLKPEVVEALVDVGHLRWGAADFGAHNSGDVHHFDLGNHGGVTPDGTG